MKDQKRGARLRNYISIPRAEEAYGLQPFFIFRRLRVRTLARNLADFAREEDARYTVCVALYGAEIIYREFFLACNKSCMRRAR